jgi:hypothetical protein
MEDDESAEEFPRAIDEEGDDYDHTADMDEEDREDEEEHFLPSDTENDLVELLRPKQIHCGRKRRRDEAEEVEPQSKGAVPQATFQSFPPATAGIATAMNTGLPAFVPVPSFDNDLQAYNQFARVIVDSLRFHSDTDLPPILSLLYVPWWVPTYTEHLLDQNGEKIVPERSLEPLRDIPWLPQAISSETSTWKLVIFEMLGATPRELSNRVPIDDKIFADGVRQTKDKPPESDEKTRDQVERALRMRTSRWCAKRGGLCQLDGHQQIVLGTPPAGMRSILLGEPFEGKKYRDGVSSLQLYLNCIWTVDAASRLMRQQDGRIWYPLFEPQYPQRFNDFLRRFNENVMGKTKRKGKRAKTALKQDETTQTGSSTLQQLEIPNTVTILAQYPTLITASQSGTMHAGTQHQLQHPPSARSIKRHTTGNGPENIGPSEDEFTIEEPSDQRFHGQPSCNGQCPVCCPQTQEFTDRDAYEAIARRFKPENHNHEAGKTSHAPTQPPLNPLGGPDDEFWEKRWAWDANNEKVWDEIETQEVAKNRWPLNQNVAPRDDDDVPNASYRRPLTPVEQTVTDSSDDGDGFDTNDSEEDTSEESASGEDASEEDDGDVDVSDVE